MSSPTRADLNGRRYILVADEDHTVATLIIRTLREDGHAVLHAYDGLSAVKLAMLLDKCHLVISDIRAGGLPGIEFAHLLRREMPKLPVVYIANIVRSTPAIEAQLPPGVPIIREPFTADELLALVQPLLSSNGH